MGLVQMFTEPVPEGDHQLIIPDGTGHSTMHWGVGADVASVRKTFDEIVSGAGHTAYAESATGELSVTRAFDPTAKRIVLQPPLVGG